MRQKRDAEKTREAILLSARKLFAKSGYQGVGVREIAANAGVTAMLVNRYFGSKEKLFIEAAQASMENPVILSKENLQSDDIPKAMVKSLIQITRAKTTPLDGFQILLRSAGAPEAAKIGRKIAEKGHQKTMSDLLKGRSSGIRAATVISLVAGIQMMRQMFEMKDLTDASEDELSEVLTPIFRLLMENAPHGKSQKSAARNRD